MGENRSLDEFFGDEPDRSDSDGRDKPTVPVDESRGDNQHDYDEHSSSSTTHESDSVTAVYRWAPTEVVCPECGSETNRQWQDGGELVCVACKTW